MGRKKKEKELGPDGKPLSARKGRWNWMRAEKIVAVHAALAASEYGLTTASGVDGPNSGPKDEKTLKSLEDSLHRRCEVEYERLALGPWSHLFRGEKHSAQESVCLRCVDGGGSQIWLRWSEVKKEVTSRIFEVLSEFVDDDGVPLSGTQWCLVVEKVRRAYWRLLQVAKAEESGNKLSKKRKQKEIEEAAHYGSSAAEEDVGDEGNDTKEEDLPAMPEDWNPVAYTVFVTLGPPALDKCIPTLAWKAKGRVTNDCVDVDVEPVQVSREAQPSECTIVPNTMQQRPKNRLEMRKQKLEYDKEQKRKAKAAAAAQGQGASADSPEPQFTPGTKAMLGVMDDVKLQVQAMNYQNSMLSLFHMEDDQSAKAALKAEMLSLKNSLRDSVLRAPRNNKIASTVLLQGFTSETTLQDSGGLDDSSNAMSRECGSHDDGRMGQGSSIQQNSGGVEEVVVEESSSGADDVANIEEDDALFMTP